MIDVLLISFHKYGNSFVVNIRLAINSSHNEIWVLALFLICPPVECVDGVLKEKNLWSNEINWKKLNNLEINLTILFHHFFIFLVIMNIFISERSTLFSNSWPQKWSIHVIVF